MTRKSKSLVPLGLTTLVLGSIPLAHAEPVALSAMDLDTVTAGATALATADANAFGSDALADTVTVTLTDPRSANGFAEGVAVGTEGAGANSELYLEGDFISGIVGGTAIAPKGGVATSETSGRLKTGRRKEKLVVTTRVAGKGAFNGVDAYSFIDAPRRSDITTRTVEKQTRGQTTIQQTVSAVFWRN